MRQMTQVWTFPSTQEGAVDAAPRILPAPPDVSDSDRSKGGEEGTSDERWGLFPWHSGCCLWEGGRSMGNERGQLAGSTEVNS